MAEKGTEAQRDKGAKAEGPTLKAALSACGVEEKHVLTHRVYDDRVVFVTVGGAKCAWRPGDAPDPLDTIRITGVNPAWVEKKPITGGGKK